MKRDWFRYDDTIIGDTDAFGMSIFRNFQGCFLSIYTLSDHLCRFLRVGGIYMTGI